MISSAELQERVAFNIKAARKIKRLTMRELSLKCGYSKKYISMLERKLNWPSLASLLEISKVLDISVYLFFISTDWNNLEDYIQFKIESKDKLKKIIGENIKDLCKMKKLKVMNLSKKSGYSQGYISNLKYGKFLISISALRDFSECLKIPIYLFLLPIKKNKLYEIT